MFKIMKKSI